MSFYAIEPARSMRADGHPWEHDIRVALPASYEETERVYPVLWLTDNNLETAISVLGLYRQPELILVSIGSDSVPFAEANMRRAYDFTPAEDLYFDGPEGSFVRREFSALYPKEPKGGGAGQFLNFLVDDVRPTLAAEYRMDPHDHGVLGLSLGGAFVVHALFERPDAFARYICGSPTLNTGAYSVFAAEERYAASHDDLRAHIFLGAGDEEITEHIVSAWGCVSSMVKLAERLSVRRYSSLELDVKIFPGESHASILHPLVSWGVRSVWGEEIFRNPYLEGAARKVDQEQQPGEVVPGL